MRELSGLSYREIAAALGRGEAHVALHHMAEGRDMECETVRRTISDADRRVLRGRRLRAHLRACAGCRGFEELMRSRRTGLAAIAPPLPAALAAGVLRRTLGSGSAGTQAAATSAGGNGLGSLALGKTALGPAVAK